MKKGVKCGQCKAYTPFSPWVYAHWDMPLTFTCRCGVQYNLFQGTAKKAPMVSYKYKRKRVNHK